MSSNKTLSSQERNSIFEGELTREKILTFVSFLVTFEAVSAWITKEALITKLRGSRFRETQMKKRKQMRSYSLLSPKQKHLRRKPSKKKSKMRLIIAMKNDFVFKFLLPNAAYFSKICSFWISLIAKFQQLLLVSCLKISCSQILFSSNFANKYFSLKLWRSLLPWKVIPLQAFKMRWKWKHFQMNIKQTILTRKWKNWLLEKVKRSVI